MTVPPPLALASLWLQLKPDCGKSLAIPCLFLFLLAVVQITALSTFEKDCVSIFPRFSLSTNRKICLQQHQLSGLPQEVPHDHPCETKRSHWTFMEQKCMGRVCGTSPKGKCHVCCKCPLVNVKDLHAQERLTQEKYMELHLGLGTTLGPFRAPSSH